MAPFTRWLPVAPERPSDLIIEVAGDRTDDLARETIALEHALADQGFEVMAEATRVDGIGPTSSVRLRVSLEPIRSMGNGCDVLVYLGKKLPARNPFHLQRGSVLLCEDRSVRATPPGTIPEGVITYPIPSSTLNLRSGGRGSGKGFFAIGVLTHLLSVAEQALRRRIQPEFRLRFFDAGVSWASHHLHKRDIFALSPAPPAPHQRVILNPHQAMGLGFELGSCDCGPACVRRLNQSPEEWTAEHVSAAWKAVAVSPGPHIPFQEVYRKSDGEVHVLLGAADPTALIKRGVAGKVPCVRVAADLPDILCLMEAARRSAQSDMPVWIVVDDRLTHRVQSISLQMLEEKAKEAQRSPGYGAPSRGVASRMVVAAEREGEPDADVGFVTWGTSQGVVREALALCRSFGLKVAALYPKILWPPPVGDLCSFAATVKRVIVVEPNETEQYTRLITSCTSLRPSTIIPEPGQPLTPMDIFLREDLGGSAAC
jgi:hypothetical protein